MHGPAATPAARRHPPQPTRRRPLGCGGERTRALSGSLPWAISAPARPSPMSLGPAEDPVPVVPDCGRQAPSLEGLSKPLTPAGHSTTQQSRPLLATHRGVTGRGKTPQSRDHGPREWQGENPRTPRSPPVMAEPRARPPGRGHEPHVGSGCLRPACPPRRCWLGPASPVRGSCDRDFAGGRRQPPSHRSPGLIGVPVRAKPGPAPGFFRRQRTRRSGGPGLARQVQGSGGSRERRTGAHARTHPAGGRIPGAPAGCLEPLL